MAYNMYSLQNAYSTYTMVHIPNIYAMVDLQDKAVPCPFMVQLFKLKLQSVFFGFARFWCALLWHSRRPK